MSKYIRFEHVARKLWCEPWLILPRMHAVISSVFEDHLSRRLDNAGLGDLFEPQEPEPMQVENGVAIIPVRGVISREISDMERISGAADVLDIEDMIDEAESRADVSAVMFDISSPGGTVTGVEELAQRIRDMRKPSLTWTGDMMASAAYWIGSAADIVYASTSADVGSIGVYLPIVDSTRAHEMAGEYVDLIRSTKTPHKGAGFPGTKLTEAQRAEFQAGVDYLYDRFAGAVKSARPMVSADAMDGRTFYGPQAKEMGLVDAIAGRKQALRDAATMGAMRRS